MTVTAVFLIVAELGNEHLLDVIEADLAAVALLPPLPVWRSPVAVIEDEPSQFIANAERVLDYLREETCSRQISHAFGKLALPLHLIQQRCTCVCV